MSFKNALTIAVHMRAGKEPPVTRVSPPVPRNVFKPPDSVDLAIDTATEISGVYPTNHADRFELVVPVLPAAGRPRS